MRITCPSCASHFELPSELLGKKGRALKCATCQHAWYQAAQVEELDLAAIMGTDYAAAATNEAAQATAAAQAARQQAARQQAARQQAALQQQRAAPGGIQRVPPIPQNGQQGPRNPQQRVQAAALGGPRDPQRNVQAAQIRQQQPAPGQPPVPPGAVSMMSRRNQALQQRPVPNQAPGGAAAQQPPTAQSWFAGTARDPNAQNPNQPPQTGAIRAPGAAPQRGQAQAAAIAGQSLRGQAGAAAAPGQAAMSWMQQPGPGQPGVGAAPLGMAPGAQGGPGAAPLAGQSLRGQAGAMEAPGQGAVSWMQQPGAQMPPGMAGTMGAPGAPGAPGIPPGAMGGPGAQPNIQAAALGVPMSPAQAQAAALAGQSMRGQAGAAAAPGQGAVSWMQQQGGQVAPGAPGAPGQSLRQPGAQAGPGEAAVSWMKPDGTPGAPGMPGHSMMNQGIPAGPGGPAVSQISNEIVAPGQGSRSLLDGTQSGPAAVGQSMLDTPGAAGGPGVAGGPGASGRGLPGQSMLEQAGASGGPGGPPAPAAGQGAAAADEAGNADAFGASGGPGEGPRAQKPEAELVAGETRAPKAAGVLTTDEAKAREEGASGGPAARAPAAAAAALGGDDEDDLVDPEADRPNFGSVADEETVEDEDQEGAAADDGFAQIAARAGSGRAAAAAAKPQKIRRPMNPAYTSAMMMAGIVACIVAVLWFGRAELAKLLPQIQALYDRVGVEAPKPGDGLSIAESSKRLQRISGVETLVVRGYVSNIGDIPRTVPGLRLELYNEKKEVIQSETIPAPVGLLDPAGSSEFEIRLELPQLSLAKGGYAVVWDI